MGLKQVAVAMCVVVMLCVAAYAAEDTASALVLHLKFDEGSGTTAKDASVNANQAVLNGACNWVAGKSGKALEFDGQSTYVDVAELKGVDFSKSFTIAAWVKSRGFQEGKHHRTIITNLRDLARNRKGFAVFEENQAPDKCRLNVYRSVADKTSKRANHESCVLGFIEKETWVHVAVAVDFAEDKLVIFKNGKKATPHARADASKSDWTHHGLLRIGAEYVKSKNPYHFSGVMDDVRIYQKALSEAEVLEIAGAAK